MSENKSNIASGLLKEEEYQQGFHCDMHSLLDIKTARIEAHRCYFCHDAPCIEACPTDIDIPSFIRKIHTGNLKGSATDIYSANILGGSCARVCPVESLCEGACVRNTSEDKPVAIGLLQQFATDQYLEKKYEHPFQREATTGKKVAVVGSGPAGLSCAHGLARRGHDVVVYEAKGKAGGLNEYGIAAYKMVDQFAQKEVEFVKEIGGIDIRFGQKLGQDIMLKELREQYDAVFLAFGFPEVNALEIEGEKLQGVINAVDYIAQLRQAENLATLPIGRNVVVIGGGSTAIDIAVQSKRLGAEYVTLVYRRGEENMNATDKEIEFAQKNGVLIKTWASPHSIHGNKHGVEKIEFEYTEEREGQLIGSGEFFSLPADMVFKAIGQNLGSPKKSGIEDLDLSGKKISVDKNTYMTTMDGVFAGGDCVFDKDLTVVAVRQGKLAAASIHQYFENKGEGKNG